MQAYFNGPIEAFVIRNEDTGKEYEMICAFEEAERQLEEYREDRPGAIWHLYARIV